MYNLTFVGVSIGSVVALIAFVLVFICTTVCVAVRLAGFGALYSNLSRREAGLIFSVPVTASVLIKSI